MAASRERLALVIGRRTGASDPLAPSRLLFACDDETTARRAHRFFDEPPSGHKLVLPGMLQAGRQEEKAEKLEAYIRKYVVFFF